MNEEQALAWAFLELPLGRIMELTGASRATVCRMRVSLKAVSYQSQDSLKVVSNQSQGGDLPPSSLDIPPPPKGGVPQGNSKPPAKPKSRKPKVACPADWQPQPKDAALAVSLGLNPDEERDAMVDWSLGDAAKNTKSDWNATYRNWIRREGKELKKRKETQDRMDKRFAERPSPKDKPTEHDNYYERRQKSQREAEQSAMRQTGRGH